MNVDPSLERWKKIHELKEKGLTYKEIAPIIGLGSGKAVGVWVSRNREKYENMEDKAERKRRTSTHRNQSMQMETKKATSKKTYDITNLENSDIEVILQSLLNICDLNIKKLHINKDEQTNNWTMGIIAELKSRNETIFPYQIRIRSAITIGKELPEYVTEDDLLRNKEISSKIKDLAQEIEIINASMDVNEN